MALSRRELVPLGTVVLAATVTPIIGWAALGDGYEAAQFDFFNDDGAASVTIDIYSSADGVAASSNYAWELTLAPGEHKSLPVPNAQMPRMTARYWSASGQKNAAGTANVRAALYGYV